MDLRLGRHFELVSELQALVAAHPLRERFQAQLMLALYRCGRRVEALDVFRQGRRVLVEEFGLEPTPTVQRLEHAILTDDPSLERPSAAPPPEHEPLPVPCHLPPDIDDFVGRETAVAALRQLVAGRRDQPTAVLVTGIVGQAGVGKSALAVRVAHQLRERFPDGRLYVNLRGGQAQPLDPFEVLGWLLRMLGVDGSAVPETLDDRVRLYRSRLSDRRVLVLLDDAANPGQVRPLLPGSPGCAVIVTSRVTLSALEGAHILNLGVMEPDHAVELLGKVAGPERVGREPDAARDIVGLCGCLPLAVRIAGAKLAARRHWRLAKLADRPTDEHQRLGELVAGDLEVRASLALSYQGQGAEERRAFRLLGLVRAHDFAPWLAAALLDVDLATAEELLDRLAEVRLLEVSSEDAAGQTRYRFHDLLRVFARERLRPRSRTPTGTRRLSGLWAGT